jgi:hypothetical protein
MLDMQWVRDQMNNARPAAANQASIIRAKEKNRRAILNGVLSGIGIAAFVGVGVLKTIARG